MLGGAQEHPELDLGAGALRPPEAGSALEFIAIAPIAPVGCAWQRCLKDASMDTVRVIKQNMALCLSLLPVVRLRLARSSGW